MGCAAQTERNRMNIDWEKYSGATNALMSAVLGFGLVYASANWMIVFSLLLFFPYLTLWVSEGWRWTVVSYALTTVAVVLILGTSTAISFMPMIILTASVLSWMTDRKFSNWKRIAAGSASMMAVIVGFYVFEYVNGGEEILQTLQVNTLAMVNATAEEMAMQMSLTEVTKLALIQTLNETIKQMFAALPAILAVISMVTVIANLAISTYVLKKTGVAVKAFSLANLRLDRNFLFGALAIVLFTAGLYLLNMPQADQVRLNVTVFLGALAVINGMSLADWAAKKRSGMLMRVMLPILILGVLRVWSVYAVFGISDLFMDLRTKWKTMGKPR